MFFSSSKNSVEFSLGISTEVNVQLKSFSGCKPVQLGHPASPILQEQYYDATGIHVGINDLLNSSSFATISSKLLRDLAVLYI